MRSEEEACIAEEMRLKAEEEEQARLKVEEEARLAEEFKLKAEEKEQLINLRQRLRLEIYVVREWRDETDRWHWG